MTKANQKKEIYFIAWEEKKSLSFNDNFYKNTFNFVGFFKMHLIFKFWFFSGIKANKISISKKK